MNRFLVFSILFTLAGFVSKAQIAALKIPFLETQPIIDGLPDEAVNAMEWRDFASIEKTNDQNSDVAVGFKLGYNYNALYLLIESDSDSLIYRDRAYQNGDGFHLVVAKPEQDTTSGEFYVLKFSPANKSRKVAAQKGIWYYNINLSGKNLSLSTQFVCQSSGGKTYFELLLPWSEIYPYHPLFSGRTGLNLCFVKAVGQKEKNYYFLKYDERIQSEQSRRKYVPVDFEMSGKNQPSFSLVRPDRNNIQQGNSVKLKTVSMAGSKGTLNYYFAVRSADNYNYFDWREEALVIEGLNRTEFVLQTNKLLPGGYKIIWKCSDSSEGEIPFSVLPEISYRKEKATLDNLKNLISQGDYTTLLFMIQNLVNDFEKMKDYETAGNIRERYSEYRNYLEQLKNGNKLMSEPKGIFRRAFRSKIDSTLQPYSIRLPENFDRTKKYPLYVLLHGSGSDDQGMLNTSLTENCCIEIAPFGRGTSNCFTSDGSEIDVKEAIDDAIRNYPVDTLRIIIAGFSMGGYGAYRIFYEYPDLFKGVAVFSGHPNLANKWIGKGYPDFLRPEFLKPFKNIPVFIYHSKNDLNCPYDLTLQLVRKLNEAGAKVEFVTSQESGHGILDNDHTAPYNVWLKTLLGN